MTRNGVIFELDDESGDIMYNLFVLEGEVDNLASIQDMAFLISELRQIAVRAVYLAVLLEETNDET